MHRTRYRSTGMMVICLLSAWPIAASPAAEPVYDIDIPAMNAAEALNRFAEQTGSVMLYSFDLARTRQTNGLRGRYTLLEGLELLLRDTGLSGGLSDKRVVIIAGNGKLPAGEGESVKKRSLWAGIVAALAGTAAADARGDQSGDTGATAARLSEVVVTAQKREERLQDVPISVSALDQKALERTGADRSEDFAAQIPGIYYYDAGAGRSRLNMRAIQVAAAGLFQEEQSPAAIYIDDLPALNISNPWAQTDLRLYDVERVEVLRGPQGTLFGSGSLGGAVRILTNKPDSTKFDASVETLLETTRGGDESKGFSGMVNLPIVGDKLALRLVGYYRDDGGYVDNSFRNEENVNHGESTGGRAMLGYTPTEKLSVRFTLTHQDDFFADVHRVNLDQNPPYEFGGWTPAFTKARLTSSNLSAEYDFGPVLLTSATTYADSFADLGQGLGELFDVLFGWNSAPGATFGEDNIFTSKTVVQELRLSSQQPGRLQWLLGAFYLDQDLGYRNHWFSSTIPDILTWSVPAHAEEKALFGEASFDLTDAITATVGARLFDTSMERQRLFATGSLAELAGFGPLPLVGVSESSVTPKFALSYKANDDVMFYMQAAKGFRIGGINNDARGVDPSNGFVVPDGWKSDSLWNYEVGVKSVLFNETLRANAVLFYIDWKDIPLFRVTSISPTGRGFNDNAGQASVKGAEVELEWLLNEHVIVGSASSYADATLDELLPGVAFTPGTRLPGTPKFTSSNYIELSAQGWAGQADAYLRLNHRYVGKQSGDLANSLSLWSDSYNVFGLRGGLVFDKYEVSAYVDNLANSDAVTTRVIEALHIKGDGRFAYRLRPRTVGVTFRAHF